MHREVVSAFIAPIKYVWEQEFGTDITTADTESVDMPKTGDGYTFIAPVSGGLTGTYTLYLDDATADSLSAAMRGRWVAEYEDELQKTLIRVVGKVTEAAQSLLVKRGMSVKSESSSGSRARVVLPQPSGDGAEQTVSYLETDFGTIAVVLSFIDTITLQARDTRDAQYRQEWLGALDFDPNDVPEVVRAKRFEMVDDDGHTRALYDGSATASYTSSWRTRTAGCVAPSGLRQTASRPWLSSTIAADGPGSPPERISSPEPGLSPALRL